MLKACLHISAASVEAGVQLQTDAIKVRISKDSTAEQVAAQMRDNFGIAADARYSLTCDDELCSLDAVVASIRQWIEEGNPAQQPEYEGVIEGNKATIPLVLKLLSSKAPPRLSTDNTEVTAVDSDGTSLQKAKLKRTHSDWKQYCWEVR